MTFLAVSTAYHSAAGHTLPFFLICAGGVLAFVALVAAAGALVNLREARLHGRADSHADDDVDFHPRTSDGGMSFRPWEDLYRRKGIDGGAQLAAAEADSAARSAGPAQEAGHQVAGGSTPVGSPGASPKHDAH